MLSPSFAKSDRRRIAASKHPLVHQCFDAFLPARTIRLGSVRQVPRSSSRKLLRDGFQTHKPGGCLRTEPKRAEVLDQISRAFTSFDQLRYRSLTVDLDTDRCPVIARR